ncbi:MAG: serine/threonine-protein kinase, partial [Phycisphaerales bacterium]|nr:serine/threonine-protein kinase [Phycisphaerales bacterium]
AAHKAGVFGGQSIVEAPQAEGYEIEEELSRGAQGAVFRARQTATRRQVALKVLLRGAFASQRQLARFEREVEMVAALKHPGIVTVYDSGTTEDGRAWLAMEFVEGRPLDAWITEHVTGNLEQRSRKIAKLISMVCEAVAAAHRKGVIHRDLKPDNILVDMDGQPHVLDFGLAKPVDNSDWDSSQIEMTNVGEFMGTFAYASPEQVSGDPDRIDVRTDVFAIGVMLYEAILGTRPFILEGSLADVVRTIATASPIRPSSLEPAIDRDLETILLRALEPDLDRRYDGPADLSRDIKHWLAHEPIEARRDDAWYVARKFLRRHWLPVSAATTAVALIAIFGLIMTVAWDRATVANKRLRGTVGMVSSVLGAADAENIDQPIAASSMAELMQRWLLVVDNELGEYPEVAAAVRLDLVQNHIGNGRLDDAASAIDQSAASLDLSPANPSMTAGRLLHLRGQLHYKRGHYEQSVADYQNALKHREAIAIGSEETAETTLHLGAALQRQGRTTDSEAVLKEALHRHRLLANEAKTETEKLHRRTALANVLNTMAIAHLSQRPEEALPRLRETLALLESISNNPNADWRVARLLHNLGDCLARLERFDEATSALNEALAIKEMQGSPTSIASTHAAIARMTIAQGKLKLADKHLKHAQELRAGRLPDQHPSLHDQLRIEVELDILSNRLDKANRGLSQLQEQLNDRVERVAAWERLRGLYLAAKGQPEAARQTIEHAYNAISQAEGPSSPRARKCLKSLATLADIRGDSEEAGKLRAASTPPTEINVDDAPCTPRPEAPAHQGPAQSRHLPEQSHIGRSSRSRSHPSNHPTRADSPKSSEVARCRSHSPASPSRRVGQSCHRSDSQSAQTVRR